MDMAHASAAYRRYLKRSNRDQTIAQFAQSFGLFSVYF